MSIAAEIQKLKELVDCGAISQAEFELAKQGLLQSISATPITHPSRELFIGKWKIKEGSQDSFDAVLNADGSCKYDMSKAINTATATESAFVKVLGLGSASGQWWVDGNKLYFQMSIGNAGGRFLLRLGEKPTDTSLDGSYSILGFSSDSIWGKTEGNEDFRMLRLK